MQKIFTSELIIKNICYRKLKRYFAGNIGYAQNLEVLVKSAKILSKKKLDFQFIIVGDGRDRLRIKK